MSQIQVPEGWKSRKLEDVISQIIGGDWGEDDSNVIPQDYVRVRAIRGVDISKWDIEKGKNSALRLIKKSSLEKRKLENGDIILEISGGSSTFFVGRTFLIEKTILDLFDEPLICNNFFRKLRFKDDLLPKFTKYFFDYWYLSNVEQFITKSTNLQNLNVPRFLNDVEIPIPDKETQQKIVQKLDYILGEIEEKKKVILELQKTKKKFLLSENEIIPFNNNVPSIFKNMFVQILNYEFEKLKKKFLENMNLTETISSICDVKGGGTPSKSNPEFWDGKIPWVSPKDMKSYEIFDTKDHITNIAIKNSSSNLIPKDSVIVVFRSGILARTIPVAINRVPLALNQDMKAFIPKSKLLSDFLGLFFISSENHLLKNCIKQVTTVHSIIPEKFLSMTIPLPEKKEQEKIIRILYDKAKTLDSMITSIKKNSEKPQKINYSITNIEQSVLETAFSGKLVN